MLRRPAFDIRYRRRNAHTSCPFRGSVGSPPAPVALGTNCGPNLGGLRGLFPYSVTRHSKYDRRIVPALHRLSRTSYRRQPGVPKTDSYIGSRSGKCCARTYNWACLCWSRIRPPCTSNPIPRSGFGDSIHQLCPSARYPVVEARTRQNHHLAAHPRLSIACKGRPVFVWAATSEYRIHRADCPAHLPGRHSHHDCPCQATSQKRWTNHRACHHRTIAPCVIRQDQAAIPTRTPPAFQGAGRERQVAEVQHDLAAVGAMVR